MANGQLTTESPIGAWAALEQSMVLPETEDTFWQTQNNDTGGNNIFQTGKTRIKHIERTYEMTNQSTLAMPMEVIKFKWMKDVPDTILGLAIAANTAFNALWDIGVSTTYQPNGTTIVGTLVGPETIGITPFDSKLLCQFCHIKSIKKLMLQPGKTIVVKQKRKNVITRHPSQENATHVAYKYDTGTYIRFRGGQIVDTTPTPDKAVPWFGQLSFITHLRADYVFVQPTTEHMTVLDNIPVIATTPLAVIGPYATLASTTAVGTTQKLSTAAHP